MGRETAMMKRFWDSKARENATYYVSSYRPYDDQNWEEFWKWGDILAERFLVESEIPFSGRETVLEIGCGIGRMTRCLARQFARVHGLDVSAEMISRAQENLRELKNVSLHAGDGRALGLFSDASFDFIFSYITFQHIPSVSIVEEYIREAGRVLRPGGHFYFQVNNTPQGLRDRLRLRSRVQALMRRFGSREKDVESVQGVSGDPVGSKPAGGLGKATDRGETVGPRRTGGRVGPIDSGHVAGAAEATEPSQPAGPLGLDHPAWLGSRISIAQVRRACRSGGLDVLSLKGEGTQYLWVKASRVSGTVLCRSRRERGLNVQA
ncbi:MAG: class I SAM-dependent methyltransferase [Candidatus Eisenbacteria bacterium]